MKKAFTLAEILITLSIIGVIASMTIPSLVQDIQDAQLKIAFKKAYLIASQSWKLVVAENPNAYTGKGGWSCTWPSGETQDYNVVDGRIDAFKSKFNVIKSCINEDGCWPTTFENYNSQIIGTTSWIPKLFAWVSADGMCWSAPWYSRDTSHIVVDTNCTKGPNQIGKDIFSLFLGADGIIYFALDNKAPNGRPLSSGHVCPYQEPPATINGRSVDFKEWLKN